MRAMVSFWNNIKQLKNQKIRKENQNNTTLGANKDSQNLIRLLMLEEDEHKR